MIKNISRSKWIVPLLIAIFMISILIVSNKISIASKDEIVAFNTKSLIYHCLTCKWAKKCTKNCINIKKSKARKRGGLPCKVCGGTCG